MSRLLAAIAVTLLGLGVALVAWAILTGAAAVAVVFFVPVVYGSSPVFGAGVLALVAGFFLLFVAFAESAGATLSGVSQSAVDPRSGHTPGTEHVEPRSAAHPASYGGFLLLGPIPIVFGNRPGWLPYLVILAVVTVLAIVLFGFVALHGSPLPPP
jgi:uncharacterized protein (TIGR00304 family)